MNAKRVAIKINRSDFWPDLRDLPIFCHFFDAGWSEGLVWGDGGGVAQRLVRE